MPTLCQVGILHTLGRTSERNLRSGSQGRKYRQQLWTYLKQECNVIQLLAFQNMQTTSNLGKRQIVNPKNRHSKKCNAYPFGLVPTTYIKIEGAVTIILIYNLFFSLRVCYKPLFMLVCVMMCYVLFYGYRTRKLWMMVQNGTKVLAKLTLHFSCCFMNIFLF